MKYTRLLAGTLAAALLCCGCSADKKPTAADSASVYERVAQEITKWDGSANMSTAITGTILTEYLEVPSAVKMTGQYMQQAGTQGKEIFGSLNMDYGDSYYYTSSFLSDGAEYAIGVESGSTDPNSTEQPISFGEYVDEETFVTNVSYGTPVLVFAADQVVSTTSGTGETGSVTYTMELDPARSEAAVISVLESLSYIDTQVVPVTAEVSSISCTAIFDGDVLTGLGYRFSADLTAEGEVMEMSCDLTHALLSSGEDFNFGLPNFSYIVTETGAVQ